MRQVVVTIETTGAEVSAGHRILEIACLEVIDRKISDRYFHVYTNPHRPIDSDATAKHGITSDFLADKPDFSTVAVELLAFLGSSQIVTYNADFVLPFISHELKLVKSTDISDKFDNEVLDIFPLLRERYLRQDVGLRALCERYSVSLDGVDFPSARLDAEVIGQVLVALNSESNRKPISKTNKFDEEKKRFVVNNFSELDEAIDGISKTGLCRGVSNHERPLLPSLFRHAEKRSADSRESNLMWVFKTHARPYLDKIPENEVEWLTIAQHHGLPTRLLDWSLSPLVACFFAVQSLSDSDAAIYIYDVGRFKKVEEIGCSNLREIHAFFPPHATRRVTAQSGMFTIHPTNNMSLESKLIKKIIIPAKRKQYFLEKLAKYGVHAGTLFPDLDGLSRYIKYQNGYK